MKFTTTKTDIFISILWIIIYVAFCEYFGDWGPLFYLIHTPPLFFIVPFGIYILYRLYKKNIPIVPILVSILIFAHLNLILGRSITTRTSPKQDSTHSTPVRICSWNTAYFFKWGEETGLKRLVDQKCDFIVLQEVWDSEDRYEEISKVRTTYFSDFYFYNYGEFLIFARKEAAISEKRSTSNAFLSINTTFKGKPLQITSVHLWNPITNMPTRVNDKFTLIPANIARANQKKELIEYLSAPNTKKATSIVVGDFNTMQNGKIIRDIGTLKNNSYSFISTPFFVNKNTYSNKLRFIQIDFAYISSEEKAYSSLHTICKADASDHCLLIIDLVL